MKAAQLFHSFKNAMQGISWCVLHERNVGIQCLAFIATQGIGWLLHLHAHEWFIIIMCYATLIAFEMMNTAVEKLCDAVIPEQHPKIKIVKDAAAGAVLIVAIVCVLIVAAIFLRHTL
jgi:diacylglycerol kinase